MPFSREDLKKYESQTPTQVSDKVSPFRGATPAKAADAAAVAAVAAGNVDVTPGGRPERTEPALGRPVDEPIIDETGELGDPTASGDGTSDATSDSSADLVDHGDAADPNADLTGEAPVEDVGDTVPAKGSARERIVELNDRLEGTTIFAKSMQEQAKVLAEQNAILRGQLSGAPATAAPAPRVESDDPGPMPDMTDGDVQFDNDKYREKMSKWSKANARAEARAIVREMTGASEAQRLLTDVNSKVEAFAKEHPEFADVVTNNATLKANQLAPIAGLRVAKSPYTAEILMHFGNDPDYAVRVAKMPPDEQLMELGEIIAEIKVAKKAAKTNNGNPPPSRPGNPARPAGAQPARKSITNAPPPPRPTSAGGRPASRDVLDPNMSMSDFVNQHRQGNQSARQANRRARGLK